MNVSTNPLENAMPDTTSGIRLRYGMHAFENTLLAILLAARVLIPMGEIVLRATLGFGIQGTIEWVLHLTLVAAMLGAAMAAREGRLLAFATATMLHGQTKKFFGIFSATVSVAVTAILCQSGIEFVQSERAGGNLLAYGIPVWIFDLALPAGFALILVRLAMRATDRWTGGLAVL